jgi:hypothetical protein
MNLEARTAIEALRAGVPNGAAVRLLGTEESGIEQAFDELLAAVWTDQPKPGIGIAGGFGTGKSHLLGYLAEVARTHDFVVSRVVISKETPLSDSARVFEAAMNSTTLPNRNDDPIGACLAILRECPERLDALEDAVSNPDARLSPVFAAILYLLRKASTPPELIRRFERFLAGGRMTATAFRQALSAVGAGRMFDLRLPGAAVLAEQRIRFAARLFQAAGFDGWCLLLDEVELIGRYTPLQRAMAYARMAVWLGLDSPQSYPGVATVYAITDDFVAAVIDQRQDDKKLTDRLLLKGRSPEAAQVKTTIRHIETHVRQHRLRPPSSEELRRSCLRLREIYEAAHDWLTPEVPQSERTATRTMRQHIKSWITQWDLQRLSGITVAIVEETMRGSYEENEGLTQAEPEEAGDERD